MEVFKEGSVITLENNYNYAVIFSTMYNNDNYIYVTNVDNFMDSKFYKNDNTGHLELVKDEETFLALLNIYKEKIELEISNDSSDNNE